MAGGPKRTCQVPRPVSLYRSWRPQGFSDLVGQDAVVRTLSAAIGSGKLAHAYLFSGPRGSGKTSAAKILARCINCAAGPTATPDNTCENCRAMLAGTALDVLEIDAASNRGIDEIRALRDAVKFAPASMRMKVYIIDEAHMLTKEGANAFLKTLEEPPPHAVFILATTEPEKLPVTVLSRCQRYAFRRIAVGVMIERMRAIAAGEGIAIDEPALAAIAYRADGGLRDALTMLEQAAAFADGATVTRDVLETAFGSTGADFAQRVLDAAIARDAAAALAAVEAASDAGTDMLVLTRALTAAFRNVLVARVDPALLERDLAPEDAARAAERATLLPQATTVRALRLLSDAVALARTGANPRLELETTLLRFILTHDDPSLEALAARVAALEARTPGEPSPVGREPAPKPAPAAPPVAREPLPKPAPPAASEPSSAAESAGASPTERAGEPPSLQKVRAAWQSVRARVEDQRPPLRGPLSGAMVESVDGATIVLKHADPVNAAILRDHETLIVAALADVFGLALRLRIASGGGSRPAAKAAVAASHAEPAAAGDDDDPDALFTYANERIR